MKNLITVFTLLLTCAVLSAHHDPVTHYSIKHLTENAEIVVEGEVIEKSTFIFEKNNLVYTKNKIRINKIFKGEPTESYFFINTLGGIHEDKKQIWNNHFGFSDDAYGVFFLNSPTHPVNVGEENNYELTEGKSGYLPYIQYLGMLNPTVHLKQEDNQVLKLTAHELYQRIEQHTQMPKQKLSPNKFERQLTLKNPTSETVCAEYIIENLEVIELNPLLGNPSYIIDFDINIRALEESFGLDKAEVIMEYSSDLLGSSVALNDNIQVSLTSEVVSTSYELSVFDATPTKVGVSLQRTTGSIPLIISNNTTEIYHATIQVQNYSPDQILQLTVDENFDVSTCQISDGVISDLLCNIYSEDVTGVISDFFAPVITSISPDTTTAGTGALLTITGNNFGADRGDSEVHFTVLDGTSDYAAPLLAEYIEWGTDEIKVLVPSYAKIPQTTDASVGSTNEQNPGTGPIRVNKVISNVSMPSNTLPLTITYSVTNDKQYISPGNYKVQRSALTRQRNDGGYTVRFSNDFKYDASGVERTVVEGDTYVQIAKDAIQTWQCETGLNFIVDESELWNTPPFCEGGPNTPLEDRNVIGLHFQPQPDGGSTPGAVMGAKEKSYDNGCLVDELGNVAPILLQCVTITAYGTAFSGGGNTRARFYNALLHELGHAHYLEHVHDDEELMHQSAVISMANLGITASITPNAALPSNYVQNLSLTHNCELGPYVQMPPCPNSIEEVAQNPNDFFNVYSNLENIIIQNNDLQVIKQVRIFDTSGRLLNQHSLNHSNNFTLLPRVNSHGVFIVSILGDDNLLYTFKISQL